MKSIKASISTLLIEFIIFVQIQTPAHDSGSSSYRKLSSNLGIRGITSRYNATMTHPLTLDFDSSCKCFDGGGSPFTGIKRYPEIERSR